MLCSEDEFAAFQIKCQAEIAARVASGECTRCNGKGKIRGFGHVEGGKCFGCNGTGKRRVCK